MSVRIGSVELTGVQNIHTEEARSLVEQRVPSQQGSFFQDLGREPVAIILEGLLFGDTSLTALEQLRQAQLKAEPLPFAADIAVGTELTDVIVEDVRVRQLAGYRNRYLFTIRLRECLEPPEAKDLALAAVNDEIKADADKWASNSLGAVAALQNPAALATSLAAQPELLAHLGMDELGNAVAKNSVGLTGGDFSGMLNVVSEIDLNAAIDLIQAVRDADSLGDFVSKYADEGLSILEDLSGLDLDNLGPLLSAMNGGVEFLKALKDVSNKASDLAGMLKTFDPVAGLNS
ncbi:hypothetical protein ACFL2V_00085 [Pseudomonadota bacterium]